MIADREGDLKKSSSLMNRNKGYDSLGITTEIKGRIMAVLNYLTRLEGRLLGNVY